MRKLSVLFVLLTIAGLGHAQVDPHFSQYYAYPLWLNPAMTGVIDGDMRVNLNYRTQWNNITNPFVMAGFSIEGVTDKNLNWGVNILNQSAGDAGYNYFNGYASVAYTGVKFGAQQMTHLTLGIQAGILNRRFDASKFQWGSQYNPLTGFDATAPSNETLTQTSSSVFDANFGALLFDANPDHKVNAYIGGAVSHLTQPSDPFLSTNNYHLPMRFTGHAGARFLVSDDLSITPNALYMRQGNASETMVGAYAQLVVNDISDLLLGLDYRVKDAFVPYVGFRYQDITVGVSYDVNASSLNNLAAGSNAFELSLSYTAHKKKSYPREHFFCPRL
jgi:type IX secretion system PorP/SprF family membrane protein